MAQLFSFDMHRMTTKRTTASILSAVRCCFQVAALVGMMIWSSGCDTPYTRRIHQLDDAYQRGDLSREDYMRFAHEAEQWERK